VGERAIELSPDNATGYVNLGASLLTLNRLADAEDAVRRASERKLDRPNLMLLRYDIAFVQGDKAGMDREVAVAKGNSGAEDWMADHEAAALAYAGELQQARIMSQRAVALAQQASHKQPAALFETRAALREAFFGNPQAARASAERALQLSNAREVQYGAGLALAMSGDSSRADALGDDLSKNFPEDTSVRLSYVPVLRAQLALNRGRPGKALEELETARHYELGTPRICINGFYGAMYPVYLRGEAYFAARQPDKAAIEFQEIVDHPAIVVSDPIAALAHLQLGRTYAISGDKAKARSAYQDFLSVWRDADSGIPVLKQARADYAKLQ
jgi:tetratricopeptide (TPR) repeat protein